MALKAPEIEGGIFIQARHNRAVGFLGDIEKYFEAAMAGWRVLRITEREMTTANVKCMIDFLPRRRPPKEARILTHWRT
jgi:hypothetical protein